MWTLEDDGGYSVGEWDWTDAESPLRLQQVRPADAGFDATKLAAFRERIRQEGHLHSVLIVRDGSLVFESYWPGKDARMGERLGVVDFTPDTLHDLRSVTKSVVGAVVGIAHGQGAIPNLDEPLATFLPEYRSGREETLDNVTVRHALTMTAGLEWDETTYPYTDSRNDEIGMWEADDPLAFALSRSRVAAPGKSFAYNGGLPTVLAAVVERATGVDFASYVGDHLWRPLGVSHGQWILHRSGLVVAASGLRITPRGMARFGQLMLQGGEVDGTQLVPADFVSASLTAHHQTGSQSLPADYGYLWWVASPYPVAAGNGGQRILLDVINDMVIVITAGDYDHPDQGDAPLRAMADIFGALI